MIACGMVVRPGIAGTVPREMKQPVTPRASSRRRCTAWRMDWTLNCVDPVHGPAPTGGSSRWYSISVNNCWSVTVSGRSVAGRSVVSVRSYHTTPGREGNVKSPRQ